MMLTMLLMILLLVRCHEPMTVQLFIMMMIIIIIKLTNNYE